MPTSPAAACPIAFAWIVGTQVLTRAAKGDRKTGPGPRTLFNSRGMLRVADRYQKIAFPWDFPRRRAPPRTRFVNRAQQEGCASNSVGQCQTPLTKPWRRATPQTVSTAL